MLGRGRAGTARAAVAIALCTGLTALAGADAAGAAAKRADLKVVSVTVSPAAVAAGDRVEVQAVVRNAGRRRAKKSKVGFLLSGDRRRGKGDVALRGKAATAALKKGRRTSPDRRVKVPASVPAGEWHVIACADRTGKVRERSERNNCKASKRTLAVTGGAGDPDGGQPTTGTPGTGTPGTGTPGTVTPGGDDPGGDDPGGDDPGDGTSYPNPLRTPNPLTVTPVTDDARAVERNVSQFGGTLTATGADGTAYRLEIPADALLGEQRIQMTPVSSIGDMPLSGGLVGAVELEPHGLQLSKPATLTIDPPGEDPPLGQQSAFLAHGGGEDFHLHPVGPEALATIRLMHFSTTGIGLGSPADRAAVADRPGSRPMAQVEQILSEAARAERAGEEGPPLSDLVPPMMGFFDEVVRPKLIAAQTSEAKAPDAISTALSWDRQMQLAGLAGGPEYEARRAEMMTRLEAILRNAIDETHRRCVVEHSLAATGRLLGWSRQATLLGWEALGMDGFQKFMRCARFEVGFDSTVTTSHFREGDTQDSQHEGTFHVVLNDLLIEYGSGVIPTGSLDYGSGNSFNGTVTYPGSSCTLVTTTTLDSLQSGTMTAGVSFDINLFEQITPEVEPPRKHVLRLHVQKQPEETTRWQNSGCSDNSGVSPGNTYWASIFGSFHGHGTALIVELDAFEQIGDLLGTQHYTGSRTDPDGATTVTEDTKIELWHKPLP